MFGRRCLCLLAILFLSSSIFSTALLSAQSTEAVPSISQTARDALSGTGLNQPVNQPTDPAGLRPHQPIGRPITWGLPQFARAAGMIFSGTVTAIERRPGVRSQSIETIAISFHVENAIRGVNPGETLTISQWIGLWSSGQRYRVGERVLLFLYPQSKLGLTSCVGGSAGRFSLDAFGNVLLSAQHLSAFRADPLLGGKSRVSLRDFALAVRRANEEE